MWELSEEHQHQTKYMQIYHHLKEMILQGTYEKKVKLPSKRKLSSFFHVSLMTIQQAYQQLIDEGYVYTQEKKGYYVVEQIPLLKDAHKKKDIDLTYPKKRTFKYSFLTHSVDTSLFPYSVWAKLTREVIGTHKDELLNPVDSKGLLELRKEIASYLEIYRGMKVSEEQIIIGSGTTSLIGLIVELLGRDQTYAMEDPGYDKIEYLLHAQGVHLKKIPLDQKGLDVEMLEASHASIIHLTPSHQYPTGLTMPITRRHELLNWAYRDPNRYIIEDDYDSEFRYQGKPIMAMHGLDHHDKIIYMNTFSKTLAPSFRISYMVLPHRLLEAYHNLSRFHGCPVPLLEQYVLYYFMSRGHFERHIHRMQKRYRQKLEIILQVINQYSDVKLINYETGLHAMIECQSKDSAFAFTEQLHRKSIDIKVIDQATHTYLILGYAGIQLEHVETYMTHLIQNI